MEDDGEFTLNLSSVISNVFNGDKKAEKGGERRTLGGNKCCLEEDENEEGEKLILLDKENLFTPIKKRAEERMRTPNKAFTPASARRTPLASNFESQASTPEDFVAQSTAKKRACTVIAESPEGEEEAIEEGAEDDVGADDPNEEDMVPIRSAKKGSARTVLESPDSVADDEAPTSTVASPSPPDLEATTTPVAAAPAETETTSLQNLLKVHGANPGLELIRQGLAALKEGGFSPVEVLLDVIQAGAQFAPLPEHLLASDDLTEDVILNILSASIENLDVILSKGGNEREACAVGAHSLDQKGEGGAAIDGASPRSDPALAVEEAEACAAVQEQDMNNTEDLTTNADENTTTAEGPLQVEEEREGPCQDDLPSSGSQSALEPSPPAEEEAVVEVVPVHEEGETAAAEDDSLGVKDKCDPEPLCLPEARTDFLSHVTVRTRSRRSSALVVDSDSDSDMDLEETPEKSYDLPQWADAAANEMAENGEDDVRVEEEVESPGGSSIFIDNQARAPHVRQSDAPPPEEPVPSPVSAESSRRSTSDEFQSADSHLSSLSNGTTDQDGGEVTSSAPCADQCRRQSGECTDNGDNDRGVILVDSDSDMDLASPRATAVGGEICECHVDCETPVCKGGEESEEDMSCSSGEACVVMSTAKSKRKQLVLDSESDDGEDDDDSIFGSEGDDSIFGSEGEGASPGREMVFCDSVALGGDTSDRSYLAMKKFQREKETLVASLFSEYNRRIFDDRLPSDLEVAWNPSLSTTAGITKYSRKYGLGGRLEYFASVELSTKVIDCESRLRQTFCHELCHVAAWLIDHVAKPPHGKVFKRWADKAMSVFPDLNVATCHTYDIHYKFRWQCTNDWCGRVYGRHSNSIDTKKQACGICSGRLEFLGKYNADGTPARTRVPSQFSQFVKEHYAGAKKECGGGDHAAIMKHLSEKWNEKKKDASSSNAGVKSLIAQFETFDPNLA